MTDPVYSAATHSMANAGAALIVAVYLVIVLFNGQLGALADAARQDFLGGNGKPAFWKWGIALLVLYALAVNPRTNHLFGPILIIVIFAMLIQNAALFQKALGVLQSAIKL